MNLLTSMMAISLWLSGQTGQIAFISGNTQADGQLAVIDVESESIAPVGQGNCDAYPQWAPDGMQLAYQSKAPEGLGIRIASPAAKSDEPVPHQYAWNYSPQWAPDSRRIAYSSSGDADPLQSIIVYDTETHTETIWGGTQRGLMSPHWMTTLDLMKALDPDDEKAAEALGLYQLKQEGEEHGVLIAAGVIGTPPHMTTELFLVTPSLAVPMLPFLMPDSSRYVKWNGVSDHKGRQIAFESNDGGDRELYVLGRRGINNLTNHPAADWNPAWSPDNNWLAFESFRNRRRGLYRTLVSTANVFPILVGERYDCWHPSWSPDGKWLVFVSDRTGTPQLHLIRPNGDDLRQLTDGEECAYAPTWQPKVKKEQ